MSASEKHRAAAEEIADTAPFLEDMIDVDEAAKILARHFPDDETGGRVSPTGDEGGSCEPFLHSAAPSPGDGGEQSWDEWQAESHPQPAPMNKALMRAFATKKEREKYEPASSYPCADCGVMRTEEEGGRIFTVCDTCWDKRHAPSPGDIARRAAREWLGPQADAHSDGGAAGVALFHIIQHAIDEAVRAFAERVAGRVGREAYELRWNPAALPLTARGMNRAVEIIREEAERG